MSKSLLEIIKMITYTDDIIVWTVRAGTIGLHGLGKLHTQGTTVPQLLYIFSVICEGQVPCLC